MGEVIETTPVAVRMPRTMVKDLQRMAEEDGRSVANLMRQILGAAIRTRKAKNGKERGK